MYPGDIIHDMFGGDVSSSGDEMGDDEEDMDVNIEDLEDGTGVSPRVLMEGEDSRTAFSDAGMAGDDDEDDDDEDGLDEEEDSDGGQQESKLMRRWFFLQRARSRPVITLFNWFC